MKRKYLIAIFIAIFAFTINANTKKDKVNFKKTVTFEVSMDCEGCQKTIEKNIAFEKGVNDMNVALKSKQVTLTFDTRKTNEEKLIAAFKKLGYEAKALELGKTNK